MLHTHPVMMLVLQAEFEDKVWALCTTEAAVRTLTHTARERLVCFFKCHKKCTINKLFFWIVCHLRRWNAPGSALITSGPTYKIKICLLGNDACSYGCITCPLVYGYNGSRSS